MDNSIGNPGNLSKNSKKGQLIVIAGPSGTGKTTLVEALVNESNGSLKLSISHTTREMRPGEQDGINYYFVSDNEFKRLVQEQAFLEYAKVYEHFYGTSRAWVEEQLQRGSHIILELDWQGANQVRSMFGSDAALIYILPPSLEVLQQRLQDRAQDKPAVIANRLAKARDDMLHYDEFDYLVVNENLTGAVAQLQAIITSMSLSVKYQQLNLSGLLNQLCRGGV